MLLQTIIDTFSALWTIAGLCSWIALVIAWKWLTSRQVAPPAQCNACGYPLSSSDANCTECGHNRSDLFPRYTISHYTAAGITLSIFFAESVRSMQHVRPHGFPDVTSAIIMSISPFLAIGLTLLATRRWTVLFLPILLAQSLTTLGLEFATAELAIQNPPPGESYLLDIDILVSHIIYPIGMGLPLLVALIAAQLKRRRMLKSLAPNEPPGPQLLRP